MPSSPAPAPDAGPVGPGPDDRRLRAAARLAVEVARSGEQADPPEPAPAELRPVLGFSRLSAASYRVVHRVVDGDGVFRARVAEQADEAAVGRVGWLWLERPVGWLDEVEALTEAPAGEPAAAGRSTADDGAAAKHRRAAREADAARRRASDEAAELRRELRRTERERAALAARVEDLEEARAAAMRTAKEVEAQLASARRDLKVARRATREAEAELAAARASSVPAPEPAAPDAPLPAPALPPAARSSQDAAVAAEVAAAARAAGELAQALGRAAERLAGPAPAPPTPAPAARAGPGAPAGRRPRRAPRKLPALPPGVFDGSPDADRHLLADPANLLVVDGYNLARTAWPELAPEEERHRTVRLLEEVQARSGGQVVVVFDGDDRIVGPTASRRIRTRYSATGQTADDAIVELLDALASEVPAVVVSSDRQVARDARARGAIAMASPAFLAAARR